MSDRAFEIAELVSMKCALVSGDQLASFYEIESGTGRRHFDAWLARQVTKDLLRRFGVWAKAVELADEPLAVFEPESKLCDMAPLSWELKKRWEMQPTMMTVYTRGPKCARMFGGRAHADISNLAAVSHDLLLSGLYLRFARECPDGARDWVADWDRQRTLEHGEKLPDVLLHRADGSPYRAIELCGAYSCARLTALQIHVNQRLQLPLTLWGPAP